MLRQICVLVSNARDRMRAAVSPFGFFYLSVCLRSRLNLRSPGASKLTIKGHDAKN